MGKICCFQCKRKCKGDVLKVGEKYFHKDCFRCKVCQKKMENTGFFCKDDLFYCLDDYKKFCASTCFICNDKIIGEVVTALNHTFHQQCFKCSICHKCFSPGDKVSMRNIEFLCNDCSIQPVKCKETFNQKPLKQNQTISSEELKNDNNHINGFNGQFINLQNSTIPIRRRNNLPQNDRSLVNSLVYESNLPSNERLRELSTGDNHLDISARSSLIVTPKHFHLPPGNSRSWLYTSPIVGSKDHPLALSTNNINRSLSNSSQKVNDENVLNHDILKRLSTYPYGDVESPLHRSPNHSTVMMSDKSRKKIQNPTVEALSAGTAPKIRNPRTQSQNTHRNASSSQSPTSNRARLSEVIHRSTMDFSSLPRSNHIQTRENDIPLDIVSASRSPSAICEPLVPPRYGDHTVTSPSRNDEYFRSSNRHLGYSMEFINSTSRTLSSDHSVPNHHRSMRNCNTELQIDNNGNYNNVKKSRVNSNIDEYKSANRNKKTTSDHLTMETPNFNKTERIPYEHLRVSKLKMMRHIDKANLESYLSDEEFMNLFHLTKSGFYQLPEWKRNDLKKRVDLF